MGSSWLVLEEESTKQMPEELEFGSCMRINKGEKRGYWGFKFKVISKEVYDWKKVIDKSILPQSDNS